MGICQIIMLALFFISLGVSITQHGQPKTGYHRFGVEFVAWAIQLSLLYFGGYFS